MAARSSMDTAPKRRSTATSLDAKTELSFGTDPEKSTVLDSTEVADVSEDRRAIDLDSEGKERPIESASDYATRLVSLEDAPTLPIWTFRMLVLSLALSCFGAVLGQIFYFRPQPIAVSQLFLQILAYMFGKAMEKVIPGPNAQFRTTDNAFWRFMNPGPFNIKEHVAITIMSSTASGAALAISIIAAQSLYYNVTPNPAVGIFTLLSSQMIGYGLAGMMRSFLVYSTFAVYPRLLPTVQLFDALHRGKGLLLQKRRLKFFWAVFVAIFVWEWFPEYIAPTLTGISVFCLANQNSAWFTRIFGGASGNEGLGALSICLDWAYAGGSALFIPLTTQMSSFAGIAFCMIAFSACYALNVWDTQNYPFLSQLLYYPNGTQYEQLRILNDDFTLNHEKLAIEGLPRYPASQILARIGSTMFIGASIAHFALWNSKDIRKVVKEHMDNKLQDPHYEKMKVYKEVNVYVYLAIYVASTAVAFGTTYAANSGLPWWGLLVALVISLLFTPVAGTLYSIVGFGSSIDTAMQMLCGVLLPGKPVANMYFILYADTSTAQALSLLEDLKLGQYTKLPPRSTLAVQMMGTVVGGILNFVIANTIINAQREVLLDVQGSNVWSGIVVQSFNSDAIAWGALGKPLYATGSLYGFLPYMLIAGFGVPVPFWLLHRRYPKFGWNKFFTPSFVVYLGVLGGGINSSVFTTFLLAVFSQYYLRKFHPRWFRKYNFLLSAALDGGTSIMIFVYTFSVGGGSGKPISFPNWALNPTGNPDYCKRLT